MSRLAEAINKYQTEFKKKVPLETQHVMMEATKMLEHQQISKNALKLGAHFENETFTNIHGKEQKLFELFGENEFLIINFYRGLWCPYCNLELQALQSHLNEFKLHHANLVAVSPQTPDNSLNTKEKNELAFDVLSDIGNKVAKKIGLVFSLAEELRPIYLSFGIDIPNANSEATYELPMPATYVINKKGEVLYAFIDEDYTKRAEPKEILEVLNKHQ